MEFGGIINVFLFLTISIIIWSIIGLKWTKIQGFFHKRYSYVDLSFILIYFIEQIFLSYLIYSEYNPQIVAGIFSIIIITTASVQNKCWESRTQKINETSIEQNTIIKNIQSENKNILQDNKTLSKKLKKAKEFIEDIYNELKELKKSYDKQLDKLKKKR